MSLKTYYAIDSGNGYVKGLNIDGTLNLGGGDPIKNMHYNYKYVRSLVNIIHEYTDYEVCIQRITLKIEETK